MMELILFIQDILILDDNLNILNNIDEDDGLETSDFYHNFHR